MLAGDVVLAELQQSDGGRKLRPSIILKSILPFDDVLLCGVSKQLHQISYGLDELIKADDGDFAQTGLLYPSLIRLGWLQTISESDIRGVVGSVSKARLNRLLVRLSSFIIA